MAKEISSSSSCKSASSALDEINLLKFYKRKYEESQKKEDKYKEKVDKHLKELITDRHELKEEVLRQGEKIADLQKALVELQLSVFEEREKFLKVSTKNEELKRNEEQLHSNIRQILAMTEQQDLRDKIIYILKDPKVEIGYRTGFPTRSKSEPDAIASKKLKDELDYLRRQLDEVVQISKSKADVVLEDCKQALEKSKERIMRDEIQIKELQKKLQDLKTPLKARSSAEPSKSLSEEILSSDHIAPDAEVFNKICSHLTDIHLSLILLTRVASKVNNTLDAIQTTKLFQRTAKIPKAPSDLPHHVEEDTVLQLETLLRQCTRLTFDINNMFKSLYKCVSNNRQRIENISGLKSEMKHLEQMLKDMTSITADTDLLNVGLSRTDFFQALRDSSVVINEEDRIYHITDFKRIVSNSKALSNIVSKVVEFVESLVEKYKVRRHHREIAQSLRDFSSMTADSQSRTSRDRVVSVSDSGVMSLRQAKSKSSEDLEKLLGIYKRTVQEAENLGLGHSPETKMLFKKVKATEKKLQEEEELTKRGENFNRDVMGQEGPEVKQTQEVLRKIDKTLSKVKLMEQGKYLKDEELCRKLAENVDALNKQFQELSAEFSIKSVQDQFYEYSTVTLGKLEELSKQCRNSVVAAEAQIAAHRSNAKHLSEKLRQTEELLRESINECLTLKQKMKQVDDQHEMEKYSLISNLRSRMDEAASGEAVDEVFDDLYTHFSASQEQNSKGTKIDPFVCMYCRQGLGHKMCEEKRRELASECRKYKTQLKLLRQETNEELLKMGDYRQTAEKAAADLSKKNQIVNESLETLEKKNSSLLELLKVEKKRVKNMERHRRLEIVGFQTDIKQLKDKIKDLEKQMLKVVLVFESNQKDMELLKTVHETAQRSKQATAALRRLKAKLYELENDIKSL